jgi:hypothetical protein
VSFCGGIIEPASRLADNARAAVDLLVADQVGAVILLPTCPLCVQSVCLIAREIESRQIPTVCLSLLEELSALVGAPRTLVLRFPFGAPAGDPTNYPLHKAVLQEALALLTEASEPGIIRTSRLRWRR